MKARDFKIVSLCLLVALNLSYVARVVPGFAAGTLLAVMEEDGPSWIPIEQVEAGDRLLSSDCDFELITVRVTAVFEYSVVESFLSEIHLTRDRYAKRVMVTTQDQLFLKYNEYDRDEWIAAQYLNDGHYIEWKRDSILSPRGTPFPVTTRTGREADLPVFYIEVSAPYTFIVSDSSFSNRPLYMGNHPDRHFGVLAHNGIPENIAPYVPEFIECLCNLPYMPPLENNQTRIALKVVEDVATPVIQMVVDTAKMAETPVGKTILEAGALGVSAAVVGAVAVAASNTFNNNNNPNMINLGELERTNQQQVYDLVRQSSSTLSSDARNAQSAGAAIYNYERSKHEQQILHEKYNNGGCEYDLPNYGFDVVIIDGRAYPQKSGVMKVRDRFCSYQEALALQAACEKEIQEEERTWGRDNYILGHHTPNKVKQEREERKIQKRERDEAMRQYINDRMRSGDYDVEKIARDINNGNYKMSGSINYNHSSNQGPLITAEKPDREDDEEPGKLKPFLEDKLDDVLSTTCYGDAVSAINPTVGDAALLILPPMPGPLRTAVKETINILIDEDAGNICSTVNNYVEPVYEYVQETREQAAYDLERKARHMYQEELEEKTERLKQAMQNEINRLCAVRESATTQNSADRISMTIDQLQRVKDEFVEQVYDAQFMDEIEEIIANKHREFLSVERNAMHEERIQEEYDREVAHNTLETMDNSYTFQSSLDSLMEQARKLEAENNALMEELEKCIEKTVPPKKKSSNCYIM